MVPDSAPARSAHQSLFNLNDGGYDGGLIHRELHQRPPQNGCQNKRYTLPPSTSTAIVNPPFFDTGVTDWFSLTSMGWPHGYLWKKPVGDQRLLKPFGGVLCDWWVQGAGLRHS